jgi:hypothetical protein
MQTALLWIQVILGGDAMGIAFGTTALIWAILLALATTQVAEFDPFVAAVGYAASILVALTGVAMIGLGYRAIR